MPDNKISSREQELLGILAATSDTDLLLKAAEIIESDPIVADGSYRDVVDTENAPKPKDAGQPCHCLVGALYEAAGAYEDDPLRPDGYRENPQVGYEFRAMRVSNIAARIVSVLDPSALTLELAQYSDREQALQVVFAYSDYVLHPMGAAGPAKAAEILRAAAAAGGS